MKDSKIEADLSGKTCVVTGASGGIGKEIARGLAALGAEVVLACRDVPKAEAVKSELVAQDAEAKLRVMQVDVSRADSLARFADRLSESSPNLDVLVNNARGWAMERSLT